MKIGIPKETAANELRVAAVPETVSKMVKAGMEVLVDTNAGAHAYFTDQDYINAGAQVLTTPEAIFREADVVLKVQKPTQHEVEVMKPDATLIAPLFPAQNAELMNVLAQQKMNAFSLEKLPRIARAQSMDILSSMSNIAGYKSVIMAADHLGKIFPMMMTAAGTIFPAKVIVIGAGVAGLQAIATARRLGAVVTVFDTRPVVAEQVQSLGADFVSLETVHEAAQDAGGYAKEQTAEFYQHEQEIIAQHIKNADVVITTALIPGKRAPILITEAMVAMMRPGSVIVDLAVEQAGNCILSEPGKIVIKHQVTIIGLLNLPSTMSIQASQLFAKNVWSFLSYVAPQLQSGQFDMSDEIIKNCLVMRKGERV